MFSFQIPSDKVTIISGGGSGHEPFCAGYIGPGLLTAGVAGSVFASPPTASMTAARDVEPFMVCVWAPSCPACPCILLEPSAARGGRSW